MSEERMKPAIRFAGFADEWERRKLGELALFSKGRGYTKSDLTESGTPIIHYGRLYTKYETVINEIDTYTNAKEGSVYSQGNEVIVPASGETAEDISRASVVEIAGVLFGGDLNIIYPDVKIDSIFLALSISNGSQQREMAKRAQGKSVVHLHNVDLQEVMLRYPRKSEQIRIGTFFRNLDHLITLHQRKYDKLVCLKKAMLEKMFPKNGSCFPEIRFAGFTDAWERRKLGEIVSIKSGMSPSAFDIGSDLYVKVDDLNYSYREQLDTQMKVAENSRCSMIKKGSVVFPKRGAAIMTNKVRIMGASGYMDTNMMALEPVGICSGFLYMFIQRTGLYRIADTSTIPQINNKHIEPYDIVMPNIEEQQKIDGYFWNLDRLITLQQQALDKLKTLKKAFLEKMFV